MIRGLPGHFGGEVEIEPQRMPTAQQRKYDGGELLIHRITHMLPPGIWDILGIYTRPCAPYTGERTFSNLQAPSTGRQTGHDGRIAGGTRRGILAGSGLILHDHCAIGPW